MSAPPVKVLHVIDGLAGGGSERWVFETVRLAHPDRVRQRVTTVHPDLRRFVYGDRLRAVGAYGRGAGAVKPPQDPQAPAATRTPLAGGGSLRPLLRPLWHWGAVFPLAAARITAELRRTPPDVIHTHTFHAFPAGLIASAMLRVPMVHTVPSLMAQMTDAGFGWTPALYQKYRSRVFCFFTGYPSELLALGIEPAAVKRLRGVVDSEEMRADERERTWHRAELRQRIGASDDAPVALSVGRLHPSKGHLHALEALPRVLARHPHLHWIVAGEGPERTTIEARTRALGVADRVHLRGFLDDLKPLYLGADVFLRTFLFEADNLSSFQAMSAGLPVVGFATGAETELIDKAGHGILVPVGDASKLADAIISILDLPDRGRAMGRRGAGYSERELDIRRSIELMTETYEEAARGKARATEPLQIRTKRT